MGTAVVLAVLILAAGFAVRSICKERKKGKSSCGGDCSHCRGCK